MLRPYIVIVGSRQSVESGSGGEARVPDGPEELTVPRRRNALPRRVGAGLVGPRSDPRVALLADVPVLPVGLVPEPHRVVGIEARLPERIGVEQPLARDVRAFGRLRPQRVE